MNKKFVDKKSLETGKKAEESFSKISKKHGFICTAASREENIHSHIDFFLEGKNKTVSVDVKARKKTNRKDSKFNDEWVWIEIKNVRGSKGWLYGKADFICFENKAGFLLIPRKSLINIVNQHVRFDLSMVEKAYQAKYRIYQRFGRRDQITQIEMSHLINHKGAVLWKK